MQITPAPAPISGRVSMTSRPRRLKIRLVLIVAKGPRFGPLALLLWLPVRVWPPLVACKGHGLRRWFALVLVVWLRCMLSFWFPYTPNPSQITAAKTDPKKG